MIDAATLGATLAIGLTALFLVFPAGWSEAQSGTMHNCPSAGKWSIAVWDGANGTAADGALASCGTGEVDAAYSLNSQTGAWSRWFAGKAELSNLPPLNDMQGVLALGTAATPTPTPQPTTSPEPMEPGHLTLTQAIEHGLVLVEITGNGGSSGDSINIGLPRTQSETLEIELPRGTVLGSTTSGFQDMVVHAVKGRISSPTALMYSPTSRIVLDDDEEQWFIVEAYCLELHGDNPEYSTRFTLEGAAHQDIVAVLDAAAQLGPDDASIGAIQLAVWAVAEDVSRAEAEARLSTDEKDFVQAKAILERAGINPASTRMFQ
jgi:hypothetical protein